MHGRVERSEAFRRKAPTASGFNLFCHSAAYFIALFPCLTLISQVCGLWHPETTVLPGNICEAIQSKALCKQGECSVCRLGHGAVVRCNFGTCQVSDGKRERREELVKVWGRSNSEGARDREELGEVGREQERVWGDEVPRPIGFGRSCLQLSSVSGGFLSSLLLWREDPSQPRH